VDESVRESATLPGGGQAGSLNRRREREREREGERENGVIFRQRECRVREKILDFKCEINE
jgi:hypothetical protein